MPQLSSKRKASKGLKAQSNVFSPNSKPLGILGGGQLARMMALKAHEMGIPVAILSENANDPAAQVTDNWHQGDLKSKHDLENFLNSCALVTFESEFLDAELLKDLSQKTKTPIFPRPQHMATLQDRLTQKKLLEKHKLPTSAFMAVSTEKEAVKAFDFFSGSLVFKKRRFGYDGYGTFIVRSKKELTSFLPELQKNPIGFIAEKFIPFERELAIMVIRSRSGSAFHLPFVETLQENSRCLWVKGPLQETPKLRSLAKKLTQFIDEIGYVGALGIELFDTGKELLINELAPRVHNSGHYSVDALTDDQFSLHVKSVMGLAVDKPRLLSPGFAMYNLLGASTREPKWTLASDIHLHWYGKVENRPGRKMGHINALGSSAEAALKLAQFRRKDFKL